MKKRRLLTPFLSALLILSLLLSLPFGASAEAEYNEWHDDNSVFVNVYLPEFRPLVPEDFPEIDCVRVVMLEKITFESRVYIRAALILPQIDRDKVLEAQEKLKENPMISSFVSDRFVRVDYEQFSPQRLILNHSSLVLRCGESADLYVDQQFSYVFDYYDSGIFFTVDRTLIDDSNLTKDGFASYGVVKFMPRLDYLSIRFPYDENLKNWTNEGGYYYALPDSECTLQELADRMVRVPGFSEVRMNRERAPGGYESGETWESSEPSTVSIEKKEKGIAVCGLKPGTTTITVERNTADGSLTQTCTVTVVDEYQQGDIDRNLDIGASDALKALQHSVKLITLDEEQQGLADMDENGAIDAADALIILQITVGLV